MARACTGGCPWTGKAPIGYCCEGGCAHAVVVAEARRPIQVRVSRDFGFFFFSERMVGDDAGGCDECSLTSQAPSKMANVGVSRKRGNHCLW